MICDANLKILNANARHPGAKNDSYIWSASPVCRIMKQCYNHGERGTFLIGDEGYPLEPWLMVPLPNEASETLRFLYNQALCSARNSVERLQREVQNSMQMEMIDESAIENNNFVLPQKDDFDIQPLAVTHRIQDWLIMQRYGVLLAQ